MWIFDSYFKGCVELWSRESGLVRTSAAYPPSFYMHLKDPHAHWEMIQALENRFRVDECSLQLGRQFTFGKNQHNFLIVEHEPIALPILSFRPFQLDRHKVNTIWALQLDGISLPPRHIPAKLESLQAWKDPMIEESAKPCRIMTAYLETLTYSVVNIAFSFNISHRCHYFISQPWIFYHNILPPIKYRCSFSQEYF